MELCFAKHGPVDAATATWKCSTRIVADYIEQFGYAVTRAVGVTGVVGLLRNGDRPMA